MESDLPFWYETHDWNIVGCNVGSWGR
jgi:hypothetical protein